MNKDIEKFGEMLQTDPELQKQVATAAEAYQNITDEDAYNILASFAQERGIQISFEEFKEYLESLQKSGGALSDDEMESVAGGKSGGAGATICIGVGVGLGGAGGKKGGGGCAMIGVTYGNTECLGEGKVTGF